MTQMNIAIAGAGGRMGRILIGAVQNADDARLSGALDRAGSEQADAAAFLGKPAGVAVESAFDKGLAGAQYLIDFTRPEATLEHLKYCAEHGIKLVIGTTGFDDAGKAAIVEAAKKTGATPPKDELNLLGNVGIKTKDNELYLQAVEELTRYYPTEDYWNDLLNRTRGKKTYNNRLDLDLVRLKAVTVPSKMEPEDYAEQAELAVLGGFFSEAKIAFDKGYPNGIPAGQYKAQLDKARVSANKGAADDAKNIDSGVAPAQKSKDGVGLVNLGYNYVTLGQFDKGIDLMKQGIAKGVSKNPEDAKLRLGYALAMAGKKDESLEVLKPLAVGTDPRADLARYWIMYQTGPKIAPSEAK